MCTLSKWLPIALVVLGAWNVTLSAQELDANVMVNTERLERDQAVELRTMANDVRSYLNSQRYTGADWEGEKVPVDVTIWVLGRSGNRFSARVAIVSKRIVANKPGSGSVMMRVNDQQWAFEWNFSPTLSYQTTRYDEFTSVLDFYMLLAIGLDMDTYDDLGGTDAFRQAQVIAQLGNGAGVEAFRTFYQPGEFTRMALITELLDLRYQGFRRLLFDYHEAVDVISENRAEGQKALAAVLGDIANFKRDKVSNRSVIMQAFFDAKHMEIADMFKGIKDESLWANLRFLDPGNTQVYEAARTGR
jgi:hypothetical protein